jgi:hypothetical protein
MNPTFCLFGSCVA